MTNNLRPGERLDDLQLGGLELIQNPSKFCFGVDAVFLSDFAKVKPGETVLDMGTGNGIIPVLLAGKTKGKHFTGLEIQAETAEMARRSVAHNHLEDRISIVTGDIKEAAERFKPAFFDVITTNPPYMLADHGLRNPDDSKAIARHEVLCTLDDILREKKIGLETIFCVPAFMMAIATQSRKALLMMVIGILLVLISRNLSSGKLVRNIIKIIIIIVIALLVLKTLSGMEIFSGINQRMEYLVAMFTGKGEIGNSAMLRQQLIDLGIEMFKKHPILGIGIGCPHIIAGQVLNFDAYLHNNFIEVLAGGGIIGFLLYYGAYGYLIVKFYKLRKMGTKIYSLCIILLLICLFREYAMVSIYDKSTYFYFMIYFMEVDKLKQIKRRKTNVVISR